LGPHHSNNPFLESSPIVYQYQTPSSILHSTTTHLFMHNPFLYLHAKGEGGVQVKGWILLLLCATHFYIDMFHLLSKPSHFFPCFDWKVNFVSSSLTNSFEIQVLISCWFFKRKWKGRNWQWHLKPHNDDKRKL
jgi:hypothetical protein